MMAMVKYKETDQRNKPKDKQKIIHFQSVILIVQIQSLNSKL